MEEQTDHQHNIEATIGNIRCSLSSLVNLETGREVENVTTHFFSKILEARKSKKVPNETTFGTFVSGETSKSGQIIYAKFLVNGQKIGYCAFDCWKLPANGKREVTYEVAQSSSSPIAGHFKATITITTFTKCMGEISVVSSGRAAANIEKEYVIHNGKVYVRDETGRYVHERGATTSPRPVVAKPEKRNLPVKHNDKYKRGSIDSAVCDLAEFEAEGALDLRMSGQNLCANDLLGDKDLDIFHASFEEEEVCQARLRTSRYRVAVDAFKQHEITGRKRALLIGCNYTGTKNELAGAIDDQVKIGKILTGAFGFARSDLLIMNDDSKIKPTKVEILRAIRWLIKGAVAGDCLWFSFSGHGLQIKDESGDEADGFDEAIMPLDCTSARTAIADDEIFAELIQPLKEGVKLTCFFDCCHSGSAADLGWNYNLNQKKWEEERMCFHTAADVVLISGCMDAQQSQDVQLGIGAKKLKGGALTLSFCSELLNNWGKHSYVSLVQQMKKSIHGNGFVNQSPTISSSQPFDVGRPFDIVKEICPNLNKVIGPTKVKKEALRCQKQQKKMRRKTKSRGVELTLTVCGRPGQTESVGF